MKLGLIVDGHWGFIRDLLVDWQSHYPTRVFSFKPSVLPFGKGLVNQWRIKLSLTKFLNANEIVVFEWAGPLLVIASHLKTKARICVRLHSYELIDFAPRIDWNSVERVVLVSSAMQRRFCELYPTISNKTTVVYNGVDLAKFATNERQFAGVIGMLGNIIPIKRVYEVILALYELNRNGHRLSLRIAGPTEQGEEPERYYLALQRVVRQLGLTSQISFVGAVTDPASFLKNIDIFVSNSFWEGQQVALLEAMASGCYCLSHFWDGAEEVLPTDYLFVTDTELREKILAYCAMSEPERCQHQARMRSISCEKFDVELTKARFRQLINDIDAVSSKQNDRLK